MNDAKLIKHPLVRIEPMRPDEWMDRAACAGMQDSYIDPETCNGCPVQVECLDLYYQMDAVMDNGTQRGTHMDGTWGGTDFTAVYGEQGSETLGRKRTNVGPCIVDECDRGAATARMCSMHYQRFKRMERKG